MNAHVSQSSPWRSSTMKETVTSNNFTIRLTQWMVLLSVGPRPPMLSLSITHETRSTTSLTAFVLTRFISLVLFISPSNTMVVCSSASYTMTTLNLRKSIPLAQESSTWTPSPACSSPALSRIFLPLLKPPHLLTTTAWISFTQFCLKMVLPRQSHCRRWLI